MTTTQTWWGDIPVLLIARISIHSNTVKQK